MNIEMQKSELIKWIKNLKDTAIIEEVSKLRNKKFEKNLQTRKFGCGKGIFTFVSENFDETPKEFSEYCK